jgi:hypothetical protein
LVKNANRFREVEPPLELRKPNLPSPNIDLKENVMKKSILTATIVLATSVYSVPASAGVDFEYFKAQSCDELAKEFDALTKAEKTVNESVKKKDSDANVKAAVGFLLTGWPFWGSADHGNANQQLKEIREDLKFITRAQKTNKCAA